MSSSLACCSPTQRLGESPILPVRSDLSIRFRTPNHCREQSSGQERRTDDWHIGCMSAAIRSRMTMTFRHLHKHAGFTLTELLITVSIASIMLSLAVPSFTNLILTQNVW